jgi:hypothetical protein
MRELAQDTVRTGVSVALHIIRYLGYQLGR